MYLYDSIKSKNVFKTFNDFDKIYTFEEFDFKNKKYSFISNFITTTSNYNSDYSTDVFMIANKDSRWNKIQSIVKYFEKNTISYNIQIKIPKIQPLFSYHKIKTFHKNKDIEKVYKEMEKARVILDVNSDIQNGLSFRIFEALGYNKKIITTNSEITKYDFYNSNNICVIDPENIQIPQSFFSTEYEKIPNHIYNKYTLEHWCKELFNYK